MDKDSIAEVIERTARNINNQTRSHHKNMTIANVSARGLAVDVLFQLAYAFREGLTVE